LTILPLDSINHLATQHCKPSCHTKLLIILPLDPINHPTTLDPTAPICPKRH
jgi:hypothetical protein